MPHLAGLVALVPVQVLAQSLALVRLAIKAEDINKNPSLSPWNS